MPIRWGTISFPSRPGPRISLTVHRASTALVRRPMPDYPSLHGSVPSGAGARRVGPGAAYAPHARESTRVRAREAAALRLPPNLEHVASLNPCGICGVTAVPDTTGPPRCPTHTPVRRSKIGRYNDKLSPFQAMTGRLD